MTVVKLFKKKLTLRQWYLLYRCYSHFTYCPQMVFLDPGSDPRLQTSFRWVFFFSPKQGQFLSLLSFMDFMFLISVGWLWCRISLSGGWSDISLWLQSGYVLTAMMWSVYLTRRFEMLIWFGTPGDVDNWLSCVCQTSPV